MNGGTNVAVAVQKAGQLLKRDAAPDAMRHVILLTDGRVDSYQAHEVGAWKAVSWGGGGRGRGWDGNV